jgi:hypothetical protein
MMKMGLLQAPIPCSTHSEGKGGLRHGPFDAGSTLVVLFKTLGLLALTSRLQSQMLGLQALLKSCHAGHDADHLKYQIISSSMRISRHDNGFTRYYST